MEIAIKWLCLDGLENLTYPLYFNSFLIRSFTLLNFDTFTEICSNTGAKFPVVLTVNIFIQAIQGIYQNLHNFIYRITYRLINIK